MWKRSFCKRLLQNLQLQIGKTTPEVALTRRGRSENDPSIAGSASHLPRRGKPSPIQTARDPSRCRPSPPILRGTFCVAKRSISRIAISQKRVARETSLEKWKLKLLKRRFRARHPAKWTLKMWKRSCRARHPSKGERWRCEKDALVWDVSLKKWKFKMWKRSCRARHPSKSERYRCDNERFRARRVPQKLKDVKMTLSCETSWTSIAWTSFAVTSTAVSIHCPIVTIHCCDNLLLWPPIAVAIHCCDNPLLWQPNPLLWQSMAVGFQMSVPRKLDF